MPSSGATSTSTVFLTASATGRTITLFTPTHGSAAAYDNVKTPDGKPVFFEADIPPKAR